MDILIRKSGAIGHITLNRPNALNSLTYDMISAIEKALDSWFLDKEISHNFFQHSYFNGTNAS